MNYVLLNSTQKFASGDFQNLNDVIKIYLDNLFILYVEQLSKHNIRDLEEKIKVKKKLPSGKHYTDEHSAGWYFVNYTLNSPETKKNIEELDKLFLSHVKETNKEEILDSIKHVFTELASETLDKKAIIEHIQGIDFSDF